MNTAVYNAMSMFHLLPVSGWHVPCWWQLHGTHAERGPLAGSSWVNPGAHCSQNWPAKPGGQEQDSTHRAGGKAGSAETTAEVMVTPASCDVSGKEGKGGMSKMLIQIFLWNKRQVQVCVCVCVVLVTVGGLCILLSSRLLAFVAVLSLSPCLIIGFGLCLHFTVRYTHAPTHTH